VIFVDASFWIALRRRRVFVDEELEREALAFDDDFAAAGTVELRAGETGR
jgi:predicted nucleic acid-binding protein